jgi:peptidyl-prolyl cis-trans isomerase SurA
MMTLPLPTAAPRPLARLCARLARTAAVLALACAPVVMLTPAAPAQAQSPFAAALYVNDSAITNYEVDQRRRFLEFIGAGGTNPRERAIDRLIEDRLQIQEARRLGLRLSPDQLNTAMREFAASDEITPDEMIARMARDGIDRETFVEFIRAGALWRELVQGLFGPAVRVTDAQIEQAMSIANVRPQTEILISEIFLPSDPEFAEAVAQVTPQILAIRSIEEFGNAARQISAAPSREQGGRVENWIGLAGIPEPLQSQLASATEGRVIGPIEIPGALGFFMLRARRDTREVPAGQTELEFRRVGLPGGRSPQNEARAAAIRAASATCADFGAVVGGTAPELPPEAVTTVTALQTEVSAGVATELARLNPGQVTANLVDGGDLVVMQLCARRLVPDPRPSREQVRQLLINRALEARAEVYLQTLRAEAEIRRN